MKAMILAAGRGERMRPLTDSTPKPLLKVNGIALIDYHLRALSALNVEQVMINHAWLGEQIVAHVGDGSAWGMKVIYSPEPDGALETAGGMIQAFNLSGSFVSDEPVLLINGDIFCQYPLSALAKLSAQLPNEIKAHLVLVDNPAHNPEGDFSLSEQALSMTGENKLTYSGIALIRPSLFSGFASGRRALAPVLFAAIDKQQVSGEHYQGLWTDVGTPARLAELDYRLQH